MNGINGLRDCATFGLAVNQSCISYEVVKDESTMLSISESGTLAAAIVFRSTPDDSLVTNSTVSYQLRMPPKLPVAGTDSTKENRWATHLSVPEWKEMTPQNNDAIPYIQYASNGFLFLQSAVDFAIATELHKDGTCSHHPDGMLLGFVVERS